LYLVPQFWGIVFRWKMDIAKVTKSHQFVPLPLLVVIYYILEVTAAYYNIKILASQLDNADDKDPSGQVATVDISIEQEIECPRCHDDVTF
jgi:hypothetical protein